MTAVSRPRRLMYWLGVGLAVDLLVFGLPALFAPQILGGIAGVFGYHVRLDGVNLGLHEAILRDVELREGASHARIAKVVVRYSPLRVELDAPTTTIVHHADGRWELPVRLPAARPNPTAPAEPTEPPRTALDVRIAGASVTILAPEADRPEARRVRIAPIDGLVRYRPGAPSDAALTGRLEGETIRIGGTLDPRAGTAFAHVRARRVALPALAGALIDRPEFIIDRGTLTDLDLRLVGVGPAGAMPPLHLGGEARLRDASFRVVGVAAPVEGLAGRLDFADGGVTSELLRGRVADTPLIVRGGIANLADPRLRLTVRARGRAEDLRRVLAVSAKQPLGGPLDVALRVTGPLTRPLILADATSPGLRVANIRIVRPHARIGLVGDTLTVLGGELGYGELSAAATGTARLGARADALFFLHLRGTAGELDAQLRLLDRGGAIALLGRSEVGTLAGLGVLAADRRDGGLAALAEGENGRRVVGLARIDDAVIVAGGVADDFHAPDLFGSLDGGFAMIKEHAAEWYATDLELRDPNAEALAAFLPQAPRAAFPDRLRVIGGGDPRALSLARVEVEGRAYRVSGEGVAGRERADLTGDFSARIGAFTNAAQGTATGPFALVAREGGVTAASPGALILGGSIDGAPWNGISGVVRTGTPLRFSAATSIAGGRALLWGERPGRINLQVADVALGRVPQARAATANGTVDVAGWLRDEHAAAGAVLHDGAVRGAGAGMIADLRRDANAVVVRRAALRLGTALADVTGALRLGGGAPSYAAHVRMENAELGPLLATFVPRTAPYEPQLAVSADADVAGAGTKPAVRATLRMPLGSINGLPLRRGRARIFADGAAVRIERGNLLAGNSRVRFSGGVAPDDLYVALRSPFADVRELAEAASPTSTLRGTGDFTLNARLRGRRLSSEGGFGITDIRANDVALGNASGRWFTRNGWITAAAVGGGATTRVSLEGRVAPEFAANFALLPATRLDVAADLRNFDIAGHLATFGVRAPLTGTINAALTARGTLGRPAGDLHGTISDGTIYGLPLSVARVEASATDRELRLRDLQIAAQGLAVQATGVMRGFTTRAPIALVVRGTSDRIAELIKRVTGKTVPLSGSLSTTVAVNGSLAAPAILGATALEDGRFGRLAIPSAVGRFAVTKKSLEISDAEVTLEQGSLTVGGALPLTLAPFGIGPAKAPLALTIGLNAIDLSRLHLLAADEGTIRGLINGAIALEGTPADPRVVGAVRVRRGSVAVKGQPATIDDLGATVRFAGTAATLEAGANVGGGRVVATGRAAVPDLTDVTSLHSNTTLDLRVDADHARFALASLGGANIDGRIELARAPALPAALTGDLTFSDAAVPLSALLAQQPTSSGDGGFVGRTTLDLGIHVPKGARVRSGAIDLGATGDVRVGGRVAAPNLDGAFVATGGTITYGNRSFRVQRGRVDFDRADGIDPQVDATAVTTVQRADPSSPGQVTITLEVQGRPGQLNIALSSQPSYSRDQILAMLVGADALSNIAAGGGGSNASGQDALQNEAVSLLNAQFGQTLLAPITSAIGGAVGLSDLGVNVGAGGSFGLTARRNISGNLSVFFEEALGIPARQSVGLDVTPNPATALRFSVFQERNAVGTGRAASGSAIFTPNRLTPVSASSSSGQTVSGVSLSVQRRLP